MTTRPHAGRSWRAVVAAGLAGVTLAGCQTTVATDVRVTAPDAATLTVQVRFDGDAAVAATREGHLDALVATMQARTGAEVAVQRSSGSVSATSRLTHDQLAGVADVTGVGAVSLSPHADGTTTVRLNLVDPSRLRAAVADTVADDDTGASLAALSAGTHLVVTVTMTGGIDRALVDPGLPTEVGDTVVTIDQRLHGYVPGQVAVTGTPGGSAPTWPWLVVVAAVAMGALVVVMRGGRR